MLIINKLTKAGEIKTVVIRSSDVVVRTTDGKAVVYRRSDDVSTLDKDSLRRGPLH